MRSPTQEAAAARYVSLTTFRRSGVGVATPVWIAPSRDDPGELVVITLDRTGKTKRLARDPRVELRPCDMRGNVAADAPTWTGTARVDSSPEDVVAVKRAIGDKYGWWYHLYTTLESLVGRVKPRANPRAGIHIRLDP